MTVKGGTTPACAACKYQRRRCTGNCPLAPYFPANQPKTFQNVHRLFGVSSITKTLKSLQSKDEREDAMKSIIYEAEMREKFPVYGCSVIICQLRLQLQHANEELAFVRSQVEQFKAQKQQQQQQQPYSWDVGNEYSYINDQNNGFFDEDAGSMEKTFMGLEPLSNSMTAMQAQMDSFGFQEKESLYQNYEGGGLTFNSSGDDRLSYVEKGVYQSSSESSLKDTTIPLMEQSDLRDAAADFSLTTLNNTADGAELP